MRFNLRINRNNGFHNMEFQSVDYTTSLQNLPKYILIRWDLLYNQLLQEIK